MIREFKPEDMEQAVVLLELLRLHTDYRMLVPDWGQIVNLMMAKHARKDGVILVAEHAGKLTGIMIGTAEPMWWVSQTIGPKIATDLVFYSQRYGDGRRMLKQFVEWAFNTHRVVRIEMAVSSGQASVATMQRLYAAEGFELQGSFFVKNHPRYASMLASATTPVDAASKTTGVEP